MRAQIATWIAMSCLSMGALADRACAGQLIDNILNRKAQQSGALPATVPATYANANYASVVSNYGTYAAARPPLATSTVPFGVPQTVAGYLPTATYDTQWNPAQVTYYRPVTTFDPRTGTTVTTMQACTGTQYQAQRVPFAAPTAVLGNNGLQANQWPGITGPGYYPAGLTNRAYYPGFQQLPTGGTAPLGTSGVSMGMPPSSLPVATFPSTPAPLATTTYMAPATYAAPAYAPSLPGAPTYSTPAIPLPTYSTPAYTPGSAVVPASGYSTPSPTYASPVVQAGGSAIPLPTTTLPSTTVPSFASPTNSNVVGSGAIGSGVANGSGVVGSAYYAPSPAQAIPTYPTTPYSAVPPQSSPCANGLCPLPNSNPAVPTPVYPSTPSLPAAGTPAPGIPTPGIPTPTTSVPSGVYPPSNSYPTTPSTVPGLNIPGATATPLGPPVYTPIPSQTNPSQTDSSMPPANYPPANNYPPITPNPNNSGFGVPNGTGGSDPEAQQAPTLPPSSASYRSPNDHFVGASSQNNDVSRASYDSFAAPQSNYNQHSSSSQSNGNLMKPPAVNGVDNSNSNLASPTLGHVLGTPSINTPVPNNQVPNDSGASSASGSPSFNSSGNAGSSNTTNNGSLASPSTGGTTSGATLRSPVPVPPLLRPSTSGATTSTGQAEAERATNGDDRPSNGKVAVPLNSPEGFDPRELWRPNLVDPNDPVAKNIEVRSERSTALKSQAATQNIRLISDSSESSRNNQWKGSDTSVQNAIATSQNHFSLQGGSASETVQARWSEPNNHSVNKAVTPPSAQSKTHNGVWFVPKQ